MTDAETLDRLVELWKAPDTGFGQIADFLDDLAARRGMARIGERDFSFRAPEPGRMGKAAFETYRVNNTER